MMSNVKSTYNFVPAPKENEVFKPEWATQVSHDIPFSDGESGEIELKITAQTPIFIRNGHRKEQDTDEFSHYFDNEGKKCYFLPGSSLKGMFRNVLEIMSFSRLNSKLVNDNRFSFRDLSSATNLYMEKYKKFTIKGGWLKQDNEGKWTIEECEDLAFIDHVELETKKIPFRNLFLDKAPKSDEKTAKYKYSLVSENQLHGKFSTFEKTLFGGVKRKMATIDDTNGKKGTLVFTGQPGKRSEPQPPRKSSGKFHEFVFFDAEKPNLLEVSPEMQKDLKFIYYNDDKNNISPDWKNWRDNYLEKNKKVPVFYAKDEKGNLYHFGLAYMYKLPYKNSVHQMSPMNGYDHKSDLDLATTIFGRTTENNEESSLKGRVMIGHAIANSKINENEISKKEEILGGPKASYFPFYVEQFKVNDKTHNTYEDNSTLRGYKRYPTHAETVKTGKYDAKQLENKKVFSTFYPLPSQTEFTCKVRFHNLKATEIGALLSAFTFHGNNDKCFHNLGGAKSFGYGKISVSVDNQRFLNHTKEEYMAAFEETITSKIDNWWKKEALTELFAMASNTNDFSLEYPSIQEFVEYKKRQDNQRQPKPLDKLDSYSDILGDRFKRNSYRSIGQRSQKQDALNLERFESLDSLRVELERLINESYDTFSDGNRLIISNKLKYLYNNHKLSKKKMEKENTWIMFWNEILGMEISNNVRSELNISYV